MTVTVGLFDAGYTRLKDRIDAVLSTCQSAALSTKLFNFHQCSFTHFASVMH